MRKELLVYVSTAERDEEISVSAIRANNRSCVLLNSGGTKVTANRKELMAALEAIEQFDKDNNTTAAPTETVEATPAYQDFEFVQGDE